MNQGRDPSVDENRVKATCCNYWVTPDEIIWEEGDLKLCVYCQNEMLEEKKQ